MKLSISRFFVDRATGADLYRGLGCWRSPEAGVSGRLKFQAKFCMCIKCGLSDDLTDMS